MRILVGADAPPNPNSGAAGTVVATSLALRAMGHDVEEIWADDIAHRIPHWNLHYLLELPREYRKAVALRCKRQDFDVIQLSQPYAWLAAREHRRLRRRGVFVNRSHGLECMADAALTEWHIRLGVPENRFPRSLLTPLIRSRLHRYIDLVAKYSDGMIVPASEIREHLIEHHDVAPNKIAVIHHGVPENYLSTPQAPMTSKRLKRLLHVGQYSFIKGPGLLAAAAGRILAADDEARLTWVCGRAHHKLVRALFPPELLGRLDMRDWMPQDELLPLYDEHGLHLAHSLYEGAAKACTEAMARGQVVISSRVGALKDHIREGENGFLVDVGDVEGMAKSAIRVLADLSLARAIGSAAAESTRELSWAQCARSAVIFYQRLLEQSGKVVQP